MCKKLKKLSIITLGCQMNRHDSEWISGALADEYEYTENRDEADFLVVNTCAVRDKAEQKFFSLLGRLRPLKIAKKDMVIGVAGCVAQELGADVYKREPLVDIVFGTRAVQRTADLLRKFEDTGRPQVDISDDFGYDEFPMRRDSGFSAWVSIMRGCDNFCSYCIVPHTRGGEQSRPPQSILSEIKGLVDEGYKEITLLGQNVNSYGAGVTASIDFPQLLRKIDAIGGIERLRFVTSHPKDLSNGLIDAMAELPSLCPALHLPMQSGSDRILDAMKREYTSSHYFERIELLKQKVADISLTSDIIVGFPGETDEDFEATYDAVKRAQFDNIFLFKYSPRPGTEAQKLENRVDPKVTGERFDRIMELQRAITGKRYSAWVGRDITVLVDGPSKKDPARYTGRTPQNIVVNFSSDKDFTGKIIRVNIESNGLYSLDGGHLKTYKQVAH